MVVGVTGASGAHAAATELYPQLDQEYVTTLLKRVTAGTYYVTPIIRGGSKVKNDKKW